MWYQHPYHTFLYIFPKYFRCLQFSKFSFDHNSQLILLLPHNSTVQQLLIESSQTRILSTDLKQLKVHIKVENSYPNNTLPLLDIFKQHHPFLHVLSQSVIDHAHVHVPEGLVLQPHLYVLLHLCHLLFNCSIRTLQVYWAFRKFCQEVAIGCVSLKLVTL